MEDAGQIEFRPGTWFVVPLRDDIHYSLGFVVSLDDGVDRGIVAAFFGPFDRPPTLDDASRCAPERASRADPNRRSSWFSSVDHALIELASEAVMVIRNGSMAAEIAELDAHQTASWSWLVDSIDDRLAR